MGLQATINASTNADWIQSFQFIDSGITTPVLQAGGNGFTSTPNIVCSAPVDANGNLIPGGKPALIAATLTGNTVSLLTLTDPGFGYVAGYPPKITAVPTDGNGSGFSAFTTVGNPITLVNSVLTLSIRPSAGSNQVMGTVGSASPNTGITFTNASAGQFQIIIPQSLLDTLNPAATYYHDLVQTLANGVNKQRIWTGTLTVDQGLTAS